MKGPSIGDETPFILAACDAQGRSSSGSRSRFRGSASTRADAPFGRARPSAGCARALADDDRPRVGAGRVVRRERLRRAGCDQGQVPPAPVEAEGVRVGAPDREQSLEVGVGETLGFPRSEDVGALVADLVPRLACMADRHAMEQVTTCEGGWRTRTAAGGRAARGEWRRPSRRSRPPRFRALPPRPASRGVGQDDLRGIVPADRREGGWFALRDEPCFEHAGQAERISLAPCALDRLWCDVGGHHPGRTQPCGAEADEAPSSSTSRPARRSACSRSSGTTTALRLVGPEDAGKDREVAGGKGRLEALDWPLDGAHRARVGWRRRLGSGVSERAERDHAERDRGEAACTESHRPE